MAQPRSITAASTYTAVWATHRAIAMAICFRQGRDLLPGVMCAPTWRKLVFYVASVSVWWLRRAPCKNLCAIKVNVRVTPRSSSTMEM